MDDMDTTQIDLGRDMDTNIKYKMSQYDDYLS